VSSESTGRLPVIVWMEPASTHCEEEAETQFDSESSSDSEHSKKHRKHHHHRRKKRRKEKTVSAEADESETVIVQPEPYNYKVERQRIMAKLQTRATELDDYYTKSHLKTHMAVVAQQMDMYHAQGIDLQLSDRFFDAVYHLDQAALSDGFNKLRTAVASGAPRKLLQQQQTKAHYFLLDLLGPGLAQRLDEVYVNALSNRALHKDLISSKSSKTTPPVCYCWCILRDCDILNGLVVSYLACDLRVIAHATVLASLTSLQGACDDAQAALDRFVKAEQLTPLNYPELVTRRKLTLNAMKRLYRNSNLLIQIDPGDSKLMAQHLLTSASYTVDDLLEVATGHPDIKTLVANAPIGQKHALHIGIKEYTRNDVELTLQMTDNKERFHRLNELVTMTSGSSAQKHVHIGYTRHEGRILALFPVPLSGHEAFARQRAAQARLDAAQLSHGQDVNNRLLLKSPDEERSEFMTHLNREITTMINNEMAELLPGYKLIQPPGLSTFIGERTQIFCHTLGGAHQGLHQTNSMLRDMLIRTKDTLEAKPELTERNLSLNKASHALADFHEDNESAWTEEIRDIRNDKVAMCVIDDYAQRRLSNVDTLSLNAGNQRLVTSVVPCMYSATYYQHIGLQQNTTNNNSNSNNNHIIIQTNNNYNNRKERALVNTLYDVIEKMAVEQDPEQRASLREESYQADKDLYKNKRKRTPLAIQHATELREYQKQVSSSKKKSHRKKTSSTTDDEDESSGRGDDDSTASSPTVKKLDIHYEYVQNPDLAATRICVACHESKTLFKFFLKKQQKKLVDGVPVEWGYLREACHSCISKNDRLLKLGHSSKKTKSSK